MPSECVLVGICPYNHIVKEGQQNRFGGCSEHGTREKLRVTDAYECETCGEAYTDECDADNCCREADHE